MKRHTSRNSHRDEKPKPSRNEGSDAVLCARTEEERRRRRREWMIEQEKMDRHNRLKRKMAMEYEIRRARNMGLAFPEGRCNRPRKSRSESPPSRHRRTSAHRTPKVTMLSKKFETSSDTTPLFKGPEGTKISSTELRKIKVDIHRNIPGRVATDELKRDIPNKEDVVLKRRAGEGSKPIFDREEIKGAISATEEIEEHRTVVTVNFENSENKSKMLKRNSASLSRTRTRSHSPRRSWSRHPRETDHSRGRKEAERSYRDHREQPRDHSRDRRKTDRSRESDRPREQRVPRDRYIEPVPVPVPIYYGNFQPRPLMVGPWVPIRGPLGGNIRSPMMRPLRTYPSRPIGIPPDIYGFRLPLNPSESKHNIDKLVDELRFVVISEKEIEDIIQVLDSIVNVSKTSNGEALEFTIDDVFLTLLRHESKEIVAKTAKAIAEIAKSEGGREKCTRTDLVTALMDLLKGDHIDVLTQTSRALGNICYENENGKKIIEDQNGLKSVLALLKKSVALENVEGAPFLRNVAAGFLRNFLIDRSSLHTEALKQDTVPIVCSILKIDGTTGGEAAMHALLILGILDDANIVFLDERLTKIFVDILASDTSLELSEMCLEVLYGQAEDENVKLLLAEGGVCELLLKLLEKHSPYCTDEATRSGLKVACDLIVCIITGEKSMSSLYNNSNGVVYKKLVQWLESEDKDLQITAVLAMGNFARGDAHCKLMVAQGVHCNLLRLLRNNSTNTADISFQHALLGALRNLVIPSDNKPVILKDGLIDVLYSMLDIPSYSVIFKLLGTLRIVIDGQCEAAIQLGRKTDLIMKIVEWCNVEDHSGVQGEANRLIAWLITNNRNKEIALLMIQHGAVAHLVKMLISQHIRMQNEALSSLIILTTTCLYECGKPLVEADIGEKLCRFFDAANSPVAPILHNVLSLLDTITESDVLREHLGKTNIKTLSQNMIKLKEDSTVREKLEKICDRINSVTDKHEN